MFHKRLTWFCDIIILNACCLAALQMWLAREDRLYLMALLNLVAVVALRQWLMHTLQIPRMTSLLNRVVRRMVDILAALLFLLTVFPLIIAIQAIIIKGNKRSRGPLLTENTIWVGEETNFKALTFCNCPRPQSGGFHIGMTPLVLRVLTGKITLCDISALSIKPFTNGLQDMEEETETSIRQSQTESPHDTTGTNPMG